MAVQKAWHTAVQWSSGYDFCLTPVRNTEGLQFDPGLDHFFFLSLTRKLIDNPKKHILHTCSIQCILFFWRLDRYRVAAQPASPFTPISTTFSCTTMITNINIPQLSLDTYIAIGLVIATPWLYYLFSPYNSPSKFTTRDQVLSLLLLIHTLYTLHPLLVAQPPNIFKSLDLPPNIPPDYLRETLVERLGGDGQNVTVIPAYLDTLLKRLGSMDTRSLYFRYDHKNYHLFSCGLKNTLSVSPCN